MERGTLEAGGRDDKSQFAQWYQRADQGPGPLWCPVMRCDSALPSCRHKPSVSGGMWPPLAAASVPVLPPVYPAGALATNWISPRDLKRAQGSVAGVTGPPAAGGFSPAIHLLPGSQTRGNVRQISWAGKGDEKGLDSL